MPKLEDVSIAEGTQEKITRTIKNEINNMDLIKDYSSQILTGFVEFEREINSMILKMGRLPINPNKDNRLFQIVNMFSHESACLSTSISEELGKALTDAIETFDIFSDHYKAESKKCLNEMSDTTKCICDYKTRAHNINIKCREYLEKIDGKVNSIDESKKPNDQNMISIILIR